MPFLLTILFVVLYFHVYINADVHPLAFKSKLHVCHLSLKMI